MSEFEPSQFTGEGEAQVSSEAIPTGLEEIDFEAESRKVTVRRDGKAVKYVLNSAISEEICSVEVDGALRLLVWHRENGAIINREPTIAEVVKFARVVTWTVGEAPLTNIVRAQVEARINKQAEAHEKRADELKTLTDILHDQKPETDPQTRLARLNLARTFPILPPSIRFSSDRVLYSDP